MNRKLIIAIIIVLIVAVVGVFALTQGAVKADTQITFLNENTLKNGDQVQFVLADAQGNPIANQEVTIAYESDGEIQNYTIVTDSEGKGGLLLSDEPAGDHNISVSYKGNDQYNACTAEMVFTIEDGTSDVADDSASTSTAGSSSSSSNSSSSSSSADSNDNIIHGGQNDGLSTDDLVTDPDKIAQDFD